MTPEERDQYIASLRAVLDSAVLELTPPTVGPLKTGDVGYILVLITQPSADPIVIANMSPEVAEKILMIMGRALSEKRSIKRTDYET